MNAKNLAWHIHDYKLKFATVQDYITSTEAIEEMADILPPTTILLIQTNNH